MTVTESDITKAALRTAVAQVCLAIGWNSIHQTPLNILVDVLHKYVCISKIISIFYDRNSRYIHTITPQRITRARRQSM